MFILTSKIDQNSPVGWKKGRGIKNAQQCWSGTCQILTVDVSNYYIKQKNCISTHLYGYVNILGLSTGLIVFLGYRVEATKSLTVM